MRKIKLFLVILLSIIVVSGCNSEQASSTNGRSLEETQIEDDANTNADQSLKENESDENKKVSNVKFQGDYEKLSNFDRYINTNSYLKLIGESENIIFIMYSTYNQDDSEIISYDLRGQNIIKSISLGTNYENIYRIRYNNRNIIVTKNDGIYYYSEDMELLEQISIPEFIEKKILNGRTEDENGRLKTYFTGFDISNDQEYFVYGDQEGLKLYNMLTEQERLIAKPKIAKHPVTFPMLYLRPYFVGENNIVATIGGYEGFSGFIYYYFNNDELKEFNFRSDVMYLKEIYLNHLVCMPSVYFDVSEEHPNGSGSIMFDLNTGDYYFMGDEVNWHIGYMIPHTLAYNGENSAALVEWSNNNTNKTIHKYNYESKALEKAVLEINNAEVEIIGVLKNNSVLVKYYNDEADYGVVLMD